MSVLSILTSHGLTGIVEGNRLYISPRDRLNDEIRDYIREHKPEIMAALQTERWNPELAAEGYQWCYDCRHWQPGRSRRRGQSHVCTHPDNPFRAQEPRVPRYCRWYEASKEVGKR